MSKTAVEIGKTTDERIRSIREEMSKLEAARRALTGQKRVYRRRKGARRES